MRYVQLGRLSSSDTITLWLESPHVVWFEVQLGKKTALNQWWSSTEGLKIEDSIVAFASGTFQMVNGSLFVHSGCGQVKFDLV